MTASNPMVTFKIDGRDLRAPDGAFVLQVARDAGIEIPTLCNHPALEPVGACRVCMVEVTHPDWKGWSGLMTACLYPVKQGIEVSTRSARVLAARRGVLSLLAARCPGADAIQQLAREYGASATGLTVDPEADSCILCGLCTRVCETYATGAITTTSRGAIKHVGTFADEPPEDCVGCGACVAVCPTGELHGERTGSNYRVWDKTFPTAICEVDTSRCLGCGSCEEACPFAVARVALRAGGQSVAVIAPDACRGCGACVGACPSGAISQQRYSWTQMSHRQDRFHPDHVVVMACGRSNLTRHARKTRGGAAPEPGAALAGLTHLVDVTEVPCAGRVSVPWLLAPIAAGAKGVLVLGRHQRTCRFDGAEDPVVERVQTARKLLDLLGIDPERVRFEEPAPGPEGPREAIVDYLSSLKDLPLRPVATSLSNEALRYEGLDASLQLLNTLSAYHGPSAGKAWLQAHDLPRAIPGQPVLVAEIAARLDILGEQLFAPVRIADVVVAGLAVLRALGVRGVGVSTRPNTDTATLCYGFCTEECRPTVLDELLRTKGATLPRPPITSKVGTDGSAIQNGLVRALGYEPVNVGPDPLPRRFAFSPDDRSRAERRLSAAQQAGAVALLVNDPMALARWATITRRGSWRTSRVVPVAGVQLAHFAILGLQLSARTLEQPPKPHAAIQEVAS